MMRLNVLRGGCVLAGVALVMAACAGKPTATPGVVIKVMGTQTPMAQANTVAAPPTAAAQTQAPAVPAAPTATGVPNYGPDTYPDNVNPLTGQTVDPAKINRIPVAAKISNFPPAVRPQFGLAVADVVFEHMAEGGLTRFTAIFLQNDAAKVGSIRSSRFIDAELAPIFQALLVTSGSSFGTMDKLRSIPWFKGDNVWRLIAETTHYNTCPPLCHETPEDTNTLFTSTDGARSAAAAKGGNVTTKPDLSGFAFTPDIPAGGTPVTEVYIDYSASAQVSWRYNAVGGQYTRWQNDTPGDGAPLSAHIDAVTRAPITAVNVVMLLANHQNNYVPEDFHGAGMCGVEIQLWMNGPAKLFRDGQMYEGRWHRDETTKWKLRIEDDAGKVIPFRPGNTWFEVVGKTKTVGLKDTIYSVENVVIDTSTVCPVPPTPTPDPNAPPSETPIP